MKKVIQIVSDSRLIKVVFLSSILTFGVVERSHANWFYDNQTDWLPGLQQGAYPDLCQRAGLRTIKIFGIVISEEMVFEAVDC